MNHATATDKTKLRVKGWGSGRPTLDEYDRAPHGLFATHKRRLTKDLPDFLAR